MLRGARAFAQEELAGHKLVMVLHDHQANPHVHLSVRAESAQGRRLNPRKADLHRWRETFARELRRLGVEAEATRQASRGQARSYEALWRLKAGAEGRLRRSGAERPASPSPMRRRDSAVQAWREIAHALRHSENPEDQALARTIEGFMADRQQDSWDRQGQGRTRQRLLDR